MFRNYLKIAIRNLKKQKVFSIINVVGLAIGITFCILLISYARDELTYDHFHTKADNIYMVTARIGGDMGEGGKSPPFLAEAIKTEFPGVQQTVRFWVQTQAVKFGHSIFHQRVAFADPEFFELFTFPLKAGNPSMVLDKPNQVIITPEMMSKYFGNDNPLGKTITINIGEENKDFFVSGILEEIPGNSSIQFDFLIPFQNVTLVFGKEFEASMVVTPFFHSTFIELANSSHASSIIKKFPAFIDKYYGEDIRKYGFDTNVISLSLQKFLDYHLGSVPSSTLGPRSRPVYSFILSMITLIVLLLACFNYMNLSIGQASTRFKEIGTRKVIGAQKSQLVKQFLTDSVLLSFIALLLGLVLAELLLPKFNTFTGKTLSFDYFKDWQNLVILLGLVLFVGLASGSYPAFFLSSLKPVDVFKGQSKLGGKNIFTRSLIILQFSVSIFLIIGTLIIANQLNFLKTKDLGYDSTNIVAIPTQAFSFRDNLGKDIIEYFKNELRYQHHILSVTSASSWGENPVGLSITRPLVKEKRQIRVHFKRIDYDYLETLGIPLIQGRNFSSEFPTDVTEAAIVNEAFVKKFSLMDPVGKRFSEFSVDPRPEEYSSNPTIIGVAKDYHFESLHQEIAPLVLNLEQDVDRSYIIVKINPQNISASLELLRKKWDEIRSDFPFMYFFLDDVVTRQYQTEQNWGEVIGYSTGFTIFIACMGLFGLTALAVARRTKEIGIRKVLGAQMTKIIYLISKEFVLLVVLANIIAWPLAYYAANIWLQNFAYRVNVGLWIFFLAAALAFVISLLTICLKVVKAALANPVEALRYE